MKTEFGTAEQGTKATKATTSATITGCRSGPCDRQIAGMARWICARRAAELILVTATCFGCATSNYDFDVLTDLKGHARGARLTDDLLHEQEGEKHEELYDVSVIPLARTQLNVFAESDDEGFPDGFVEADIDAYLPLFGFVDATINRYDSDRRMYERHDFNSYLWGLFQTHKEQIDTNAGLREKRMRRFLWIFDWRSSPKYVESTREVPPR